MSAGKGWSRALLAVGAIASLAANVRHSFIPPKPAPDVTPERWREYAAAYSDYSPAPESVFWAGLVVLAAWMSLEAIVRIRWDGHRALGFVIKGLLTLSVFAVAVVASYNHQSSILEYAGAGWFEVKFGPLLPDGMMLLGLGGLIMDSLSQDKDTPKGPSLAERVAALRAGAVDTIAAAKGQDKVVPVDVDKRERPTEIRTDLQDMSRALDAGQSEPEFGTWTQDMPRVPKVNGVRPMTETEAQDMSGPSWTDLSGQDTDMDQLPVDMPTEDKPRRTSWDKDKALSLIKDTVMTDHEIGAEVGTSYKTIQRLRRKWRAEAGLS